MLAVSCQNQPSSSSQSCLRLNFAEGDVPCLHPQWKASHIRSLCLSQLLFDGLTRVDANGAAQLSGAASYAISDDGLTYTFFLRDTKWSDGSPVTAYDYERAWKYAVDPKTLCAKPEQLYLIKNARQRHAGLVEADAVGVRALNDKTLVVELAYLSPMFLEQIASPPFAPLKDPERESAAFNGAFAVEKWDRNYSLILKKNPFFWNRDKVSFEHINISFVQDQACLRLFQDKKTDWAGDPCDLIQIEALADLQAQGLLHKQSSNSVCSIHINMSIPWLQSKPIRQALSLAVNRDQMECDSCASPVPQFMSLVKPDHSQNIAKARELFEQGLKELGLTRETFPTLKLRYSEYPRVKRTAPYLQQAWQNALGIKVELVFSDWNTFRARLVEGDFELGICNEPSMSPDPMEILERFSSPATNYSRWSHPEFKALLTEARNARTAAERTETLKRAEEFLIDELPLIPLSSMVQRYLKNPQVVGYVFGPAMIDFSYAKKE